MKNPKIIKMQNKYNHLPFFFLWGKNVFFPIKQNATCFHCFHLSHCLFLPFQMAFSIHWPYGHLHFHWSDPWFCRSILCLSKYVYMHGLSVQEYMRKCMIGFFKYKLHITSFRENTQCQFYSPINRNKCRTMPRYNNMI